MLTSMKTHLTAALIAAIAIATQAAEPMDGAAFDSYTFTTDLQQGTAGLDPASQRSCLSVNGRFRRRSRFEQLALNA